MVSTKQVEFTNHLSNETIPICCARAQPGGLVPVGRRGFRQSETGKQTRSLKHRLFGLPLVPCDGA